MAFQQTMAMSSPVDGQTPPAGGGFGGTPGSSPGSAPGGGFGAPAASPPGGGFGAPPSQPQPGFGGPAAAAPVKKKSNTLMFVGIGCAALLALSCIGGIVFFVVLPMMAVSEAVEEFDEAIEEANANAGSTGSTGSTGSGGSTLCSRAAECCEAYVAEMTSAGTPGLDAAATCAGVRMAGVPDSTCQTTIDGYRTGLEAMGRTVPASCQ